MTPRMERRALQGAIALLALVPVAAGLAGVLQGQAMVDGLAGLPSQDSHMRYLSGLLLAIGVAWWSAIAAIERCGARVRLLAALVACGGLARLLSLVVAGPPSWSMLGALVLELIVAPAIALWQVRVARRMTAP
ncbi:MAG: DUF4345 domain-containing protein [Alphaproteobacteria bacterium]|nr:DUF4345 domain-containing protein [Alphaproteobacteria bacterium]MCW5744195.1 DUF4345 domain-containing protein [Alphaproteobacteria bacterium]